MIITTNGIVALPKEGDQILTNMQPWKCVYQQIESVLDRKATVPMDGYFGVELRFYDKDADPANIVIYHFDCKEQSKD